MLCFEAEIKLSTNKDYGLGLFSKEFLPSGMIVWEFIEGIDQKIHKDNIAHLPKAQKNYFDKYAWIKGDYVYTACDLSNFINHSFSPNLISSGNYNIAAVDINIGDEIFINYQDFDDSFDSYKHLLF